MMHISRTVDALGRLVAQHPDFWVRAGNLESKMLVGGLDQQVVRVPVFISGLARSGSTLLLEILAAQPDVATHRYQDFPFLFTPYWWNKTRAFQPWTERHKRERAHGDGMMVNAQSPEALEEMLWMAFFPNAHQANGDQRLDAQASYPEFERFYRQHIQKLLLVRAKERYVAKNHYLVTRLPYLLRLFPDMRLLIPVRHPVAHIASLIRQHRRFLDASEHDRRVASHMRFTGHFEFGPARMPVGCGDPVRLQAITDAWQQGDEVGGWALYWDTLYGFLYHTLASNDALKRAAMVVRYESLCERPLETIENIFTHVQIVPHHDMTVAIHKPGDGALPLVQDQVQRILQITGQTATLYGY